MSVRWFPAASAVTVAALALGGCLFRTVEAPRFYRPAAAALDAETEPSDAPAGNPVRLGSVRSAPFLRERIVWRASPVEYGLYEQRRWFELPSRYVRRALASTLATTPGLRPSQDVAAPRLDVEVTAFDEILAPKHEAQVALVATLRDGTQQRFERTFAARVPIAADDGAATAEAMGRALDEAVKQVAAATAKALGAARKPTPAPRSRGGR